MKKLVLAALAVAMAGVSVPASADVMQDIKAKGVLTVGVKADYKPFGFRDPTGSIVGIEPDLAADIAKRLGVKLELVPVVASNRIEFLNQGKVDLLIATVSDKPERRKSVLAIDPQYYSDSVNILMTQKAKYTDWESLKGKTICATSGSFYNKEVEAKYGVTIKAFDGSEKPLFALKQGECIGYLYDQTFVQGKLLDDEWKSGFYMPLPGILETPWIMAVKTGEDGFAKFLSDTTVDWFKQGLVVDEEKKWGIQPTDYSKRMHEEKSKG
ncbi:transporter substrate-binding domain-containing protein [Hansschlegelia plantiphila]|uniref:Amino acid ABC transporter n=1 Tax=Hansschlegelia plantiphila TaxID=374655 RepID=A0A9W6J3S5_9HYPH|nr:transporter substrate-binding domain-containing protein [Hansschlegelia plantiphila]GLK69231.1 amino acid ABC transporter [Hansschlegelia plantiphila]